MCCYPMRFVQGLKCTFIHHHTWCLPIVVALLSLSICAGSLKHFLCANVQKAYCKFRTCFLGAQQRTWPASIHMHSLTKAFAQRVNVYIAKYFKRVCETVLLFNVPMQKVRDLQMLLRCMFSFENVAHEQRSIL